ncbi:hypothetical protein ACH5RR_037226 [Cinchona calisaya]|uniref:SPARK domain-containing protein n=1 Tax=Cinchona calisaya TaxID=153742 RepID=A0ABD2Y8N2_9GENT
MKEVVPRTVLIQLTLVLLDICPEFDRQVISYDCPTPDLPKSMSSPYSSIVGSDSIQTTYYSSSYLSPSTDLQPLPPLQAPSPLIPFRYNSLPKLSGLCMFNFSSAESILRVTATDCWSSLAPYLANVICCPQYEASLVILLGQSSNHTGQLALNSTHASDCISDFEKILESQGANNNLHNICSVAQSNLTGGSCPVVDTNKVDSILSSSRILDTCYKINMPNECCTRICQNAISAAAEKLALRNYSMKSFELPDNSAIMRDCTSIVLRWIASKLDPSSANRLLRGLTSCNLNEACPLVFPDIDESLKECEDQLNNQTSCCDAMESYMSHLQEQSFITNLQALNCAGLLGLKLQSANISQNVYNQCHINLQDFSPQESGCLLPSLPSDVTFDESSGIGFICDLNDNLTASWPSGPFVSASSCNKSGLTSILPEIPTVTSAQIGKILAHIFNLVDKAS